MQKWGTRYTPKLSPLIANKNLWNMLKNVVRDSQMFLTDWNHSNPSTNQGQKKNMHLGILL